MTAAVTGATGLVGRFIVEKLIQEGVAVRAWRRAGSDISGLPSAVHWIEGDLSAPESAAPLLDGADMLVHSALEHEPGRYRGGEGSDLPQFLRANVGETLALLAEARASGVRRAVFISSRAVFGAEQGAGPLSDDEPTRPDSNYGAAKAAVEAFVRHWGVHERWPVASLRPTGVYGLVTPAEKSKWFDIVASSLRGEPVPVRAGTEVHGRDVAESVWKLLTAPSGEIAGRMFNCSDLAVSTRDIVRLVRRAAQVSAPLPAEPPPVGNVMDCAGLKRLGVSFGGWPAFETTVGELVAAARGPTAASA